jgi:hypothetical protein
MSTEPSTSTSRSNFVVIFDAAVEAYKQKTKTDLASHPLLPSLQSCDSPEAVLTVLRDQIPAFSQSHNGDDGLTKWVAPTVNVLHAFSDTLGKGIGLVSIKKFPCEEFLPYCLLSGIPVGKCYLCGNWCSPLGRCLSWIRCTAYFDTRTHRRLKMRYPGQAH